uniref:DNA2/NAM7 helicase-like C-terminal domain-containing protein n=1 Tax=Chromera velia CCMP2878 TaxID=1169474 RepID=A0A0G4HRE5_9ALVE|eukprot:Cvel_30619.t1-p1 / transcript=Cvel_30619.t1 / gene=Cvel_30619 / organism=Chromera_velia_CCMP2878 / gene_product=hypothetical protein / transcript_product=hypothetical protein / location=Cvel_scaffold4397:1370-1765(-) / protein_length=132 / sequence_SO=supercontig / SO=protein_coding / is_pseudo=false
MFLNQVQNSEETQNTVRSLLPFCVIGGPFFGEGRFLHVAVMESRGGKVDPSRGTARDTLSAPDASFENEREALCVARCVRLLVDVLGVAPDDIVVLSNYLRQVEKIREFLRGGMHIHPAKGGRVEVCIVDGY